MTLRQASPALLLLSTTLAWDAHALLGKTESRKSPPPKEAPAPPPPAATPVPHPKQHAPNLQYPATQQLGSQQAAPQGVYSVGANQGRMLAGAPYGQMFNTGGWMIQVDPEAAKTAPPVKEEDMTGRNATLSLSADQLVNLMGDPLYGLEGRESAAAELLAAGEEAMPALVAAVHDRRVFGTTVGEGGGPHEVTVGERAQDMLYAMITPRYRSPFAHTMTPKHLSMYRVDDWQAWWSHNRGRSLQQIRGDVRAAMDAYWKTGGEEQVLH